MNALRILHVILYSTRRRNRSFFPGHSGGCIVLFTRPSEHQCDPFDFVPTHVYRTGISMYIRACRYSNTRATVLCYPYRIRIIITRRPRVSALWTNTHRKNINVSVLFSIRYATHSENQIHFQGRVQPLKHNITFDILHGDDFYTKL